MYFRLTVILMSASLFSGCFGSPGDQPEIGPVTGTITLDGKPLPWAKIYFDPVSGGRTSTAVSDDNGDYDLEYNLTNKGAKVGKNSVRVITQWDPDEESKLPGGLPERVPAKYHTSGALEFDVLGKANVIDLKLTSQK
ncbi:MAG TPA: carboxypeptidase-like regulatory domain-containing protein [Planctomicrobium sp.]|nr:carboxypeptidase-like regulatory domain-containing protein [Planctomicrobium sp.]